MATERETLVGKIVDQLELILKTNGYSTDLGLHVSEWKATPFDQADLPAVDVRDVAEEVFSPSEAETMVGLDLSVVMNIVAAPGSSGTDVRTLLGDVYKAVGSDVTWSGTAQTTVRISDVMTVGQDEVSLAGAQVTLSVRYFDYQFKTT